MTYFVFDMDGTVTESSRVIDPSMKMLLLNLAAYNKVIFVSGAGAATMSYQLGTDLLSLAHMFMPCSTGQVWAQEKILHNESIINTFDEEHAYFLMKYWNNNEFPLKPRTSRNIFDVRDGLINFSITGRPCSQEVRDAFIMWDNAMHDRKFIAYMFNKEFNNGDDNSLMARVAGQTGIDITLANVNKGNVLTWINEKEDVIFFGDQCQPDGNDHDIAKLIDDDKLHQVNGPKETAKILMYKYIDFMPDLKKMLKDDLK